MRTHFPYKNHRNKERTLRLLLLLADNHQPLVLFVRFVDSSTRVEFAWANKWRVERRAWWWGCRALAPCCSVYTTQVTFLCHFAFESRVPMILNCIARSANMKLLSCEKHDTNPKLAQAAHLPSNNLAISAHLFPNLAWYSQINLSSSGDQGSLRISVVSKRKYKQLQTNRKGRRKIPTRI